MYSSTVQALRPCTDRMARRGSRVIPVLFFDHGTGRACGVSVTPRTLFIPGKDPIHIVQKAGGLQVRSGQVWKISPHHDSIPGPSSP